jgi:hypothetical protein
MIRRMETPHESVWLGVRGWHRPRTRWFVLAAVLLVLSGSAIWGAVSWTHYQPLERGSYGLTGHLGNRILYGYSLRNEGAHTVRVTSIDDPDVPGFTEVKIFIGPRGETGTSDVTHPFVPFELAPGEERAISVTGLVRCPKPNEGFSSIRAARIHFTAFKLSHAAWVEIGDFPIRPPKGACPHP